MLDNTLENYLFNAKERIISFNDVRFSDAFEDRISKLMKQSPPQLISIDVFDTVLLRPAISEFRHFKNISEKISTFLKERGVNKHTLEILVARYISTEINYKTSRSIKGCREGSINEIYESVIHQLELQDVHFNELVQIELEHEKEILKPNVKLWEVLRNYKNQDNKVVLLSDMYLHDHQIVDLVEHFFSDYEDVIDETISSADHKISKASGLIFPFIKEKYDTEDDSICIHIGDSLKGDVEKANQNGFKPIFLPKSRNHELEVLRDKEELLKEMNNQYNINFSQWVR